jgi:hypothetical protein
MDFVILTIDLPPPPSPSSTTQNVTQLQPLLPLLALLGDAEGEGLQRRGTGSRSEATELTSG